MTITKTEAKAINENMGRVNALQAFCLILARSIPTAISQVVASDLKKTTAQLDANVVALPIPDSHNDAMLAVLQQLQTELSRPR